jgi:ElaB/YqjD/DUF883 family membrane-anchored ribosome-binding protein
MPRADSTLSGAVTGAAASVAPETTAQVSMAELQTQIAALKSDIADLTATVSRYGRAQGEALKAQARDGFRMVAEKSASGAQAAGEYAGQKYAETEEYVRSHPAASVGIAAGLGFLAGLMSARR